MTITVHTKSGKAADLVGLDAESATEIMAAFAEWVADGDTELMAPVIEEGGFVIPFASIEYLQAWPAAD